MKFKRTAILLILLLALPLFLEGTLNSPVAAQTAPDVYFGVDVAYGDVDATLQLIDNVSAFTNFFVVGCSGDYNETRLTTITQHLYGKGLTFIVFSDDPRYPSKDWFQTATDAYGSSFLGVYFYDEPGGRQLDQAKYPTVPSATDYTDAAHKYVGITSWWLRNGSWAITNNFAYPTQYKLFTSDYGLYWYDYLGGYDTVLAEFGWNYSRQLNVALCRGAATALGKDWGVIMCWTYMQPPYLESGPELYDDLLLAYQNGAKYIVVFDSNEDYTADILQPEHFQALQQFWQYVQDNPRSANAASDRAAYVLPEHYAYGFRGPGDKIWGLWGPDAVTSDVCMNVSVLMLQHDRNLDIIYPDGPQSIETIGYQNVYYWNDTQLAGTPTSSPEPTAYEPLSFYLPPIYYFVIAAAILATALAFASTMRYRKKPPKLPPT